MAALLWGFLFSARATGKRPRPAWWLDLHNWMGGLALVFIGIHVVAAWVESTDIGLTQVFIPGTATPDRWGIAFGVVSLYLMSIVVFTTWPKRLANRKLWRAFHLLAVPAAIFALIHSFQSGSDLRNTGYKLVFILLALVSGYGLFERLTSLVQQRRRKAARAALKRVPDPVPTPTKDKIASI